MVYSTSTTSSLAGPKTRSWIISSLFKKSTIHRQFSFSTQISHKFSLNFDRDTTSKTSSLSEDTYTPDILVKTLCHLKTVWPYVLSVRSTSTQIDIECLTRNQIYLSRTKLGLSQSFPNREHTSSPIAGRVCCSSN